MLDVLTLLGWLLAFAIIAGVLWLCLAALDILPGIRGWRPRRDENDDEP